MTDTAAPRPDKDRPRAIAAYVAVTAAYWAFMLTDGALRMLVLLHFHTLGFSPIQLAYLFLLYELAGVVTNLSAGWLAARFGLTSTLYGGLALQILALGGLAFLDPTWGITASVVFVMAVQGLSGVAKDLAKMSSKSAVKVLAPDGEGTLFRWVAALTGSKNVVKGIGFLLGTVLLGLIGFVPSVLAMAGVLTVILLAVAVFLPPGLPAGRKGAKFREVFSKSRDVNLLSGARMFLFGARDVWFVVGVPLFFYSVWSDGTVAGNRAAFFQIGTFMAAWIIGYGIVQASAPGILRAATLPLPKIRVLTARWVLILTVIPVALAAAAAIGDGADWLVWAVVGGLMAFGVVFALNSALHSYLILALTSAERVTMDVGFYYMSNAAGRLVGTLLSGVSYQLGGLPACLATAAVMAGLSRVFAARLARED